MSFLVISEILGLVVNGLTASEMHSLLHTDIFLRPIQIQLRMKQKVFINFLLNFQNLHRVLNILRKNLALIVYVFLKLETAKDVVS